MKQAFGQSFMDALFAHLDRSQLTPAKIAALVRREVPNTTAADIRDLQRNGHLVITALTALCCVVHSTVSYYLAFIEGCNTPLDQALARNFGYDTKEYGLDRQQLIAKAVGQFGADITIATSIANGECSRLNQIQAIAKLIGDNRPLGRLMTACEATALVA